MSEIQDRLEYLLDKEREKVEKLQSRLSHLSAVNEKYRKALRDISSRKQYSCACVGEDCGCDFSFAQFTAEEALADEMGEK